MLHFTKKHRTPVTPPVTTPQVPVISVAPVIFGNLIVGSTLTSTPGTWTNGPTAYFFQWFRGTSQIAGAINNTYVLQNADVGQTIFCQVTSANAVGNSLPSMSNGLGLVISPPNPVPVNTVAPHVSGVAGVGLSNVVDGPPYGTWTNSPTSYSFQWYANGIAIAGAVSSVYASVIGDVGKMLTCAVVATNANGDSAPALSNAVGPVASLVPLNTTAPTISGSTSVGSTLTLTSNGAWTNSPTSYLFQWQRDGNPISGATNNTYVLVGDDAGHNVKCVVIAVNASGNSNPANSNSLGPVTIPVPSNTVLPLISGTGVVGNTLTCSTGTWTNSPTGYSYQWKNNGTNITGGTNAGYVLVGTDAGCTITCVVTATNSGGSTPATSSNSISVGSTISAGTLAFDASWTTGQNPPNLQITIPDSTVSVNDWNEISFSTTADFSASVTTLPWDQITSDEVEASADLGGFSFNWGSTTPTPGALTYFRQRFGRGVDAAHITTTSAYSNIISDTMAAVIASVTLTDGIYGSGNFDKSKYVKIVSPDYQLIPGGGVGSNTFARSTKPAVNSKFYVEFSLDSSRTGNPTGSFFGFDDRTVDLNNGGTGVVSGTNWFPGGVVGNPGITFRTSVGSTALVAYYNGSSHSISMPSNLDGDHFGLQVDTTAHTIKLTHIRGGTTTVLSTITLTSQIPSSWYAIVGGLLGNLTVGDGQSDVMSFLPKVSQQIGTPDAGFGIMA